MLLNFPPLLPGMLLVSYLEWFARRNGFTSFHEFRKHYNPCMGKRNRKLSLAKNALYPRFYGVDRAIDDVLDMLWDNGGISFRDAIRNNTLFPILYSLFAPKRQSLFEDIVKPEGSTDRKAVLEAYNAFRSLHGMDYMAFANNGFLSKTNINDEAEIRYCPDCVQADTEKYGMPLGWIWHNIPYVCVCPIHKTELVTYPNGRPGVDEASFVANPFHGSANEEYASFVYDFLKHVYSERKLYDLTSFTVPIYQFQKEAKLSSWRLLISVTYGGYIDSAFDDFAVRSTSDVFSDTYYGDESLNYALYEPQNMFSVLSHIFGTFSYFLPSLTSEDHKPAMEAVNAFYERCASSITVDDLKKMDIASLKRVIADKTSNECTLVRADGDQYFIKAKGIPSFVQFQRLIAGNEHKNVVSVSFDDIASDLSQRHSYMFLPGVIEYSPIAAKAKEQKLFSSRCDSLIKDFLESGSSKMTIREMLYKLSCSSYGLLTRKECTALLLKAVNRQPLLQRCSSSKDTVRIRDYSKGGVGA